MRHFTYVLTLAVMLCSCGFHLRGQFATPSHLQPLYVDGAAGSVLVATLEQQLRTTDLQLVDNRSEARYILRLSDENQQRRTMSVGNGNRAAEYQLIESVIFEVLTAGGEPLNEAVTISERRVLSYNADNELSSRSEEQLIRREMKQNLASKILRQLSAIKPATNETAP